MSTKFRVGDKVRVTGGEESAILKVLENMSAITKLDDNPSNVLNDLG